MADKLFDRSLVFSSAFVVQVSRQLFKDVFGVTLLFFLVGIPGALRRGKLCEPLAVLGFLAYLVIVARGNYVHNYYQLPVMMLAPFLAALGVVDAAFWTAQRVPRWRGHAPAIAGAFLLVITFSTFLRSVSANSWYGVSPDVVQACRESATWLRPDDRLLFADYNDPKIMFCMDRQGWLLPRHLTDADHLSDAVRDGATVAVIVTESRGSGAEWAEAHGTLVFSNPALAAYRLNASVEP
jgi:hypothetical protein